MPSLSQVTPNKDGSVAFSFVPKQTGLTSIAIKENNENVLGSPFSFVVDDFDSGTNFVTAFGSGLMSGITGELATFTVSGAGSRDLDIKVDGPAGVQAKSEDNKDGTATCSYVPTAAGVYNVTIKVKGKEISGSPFPVKVSSEGRKRSQISINTCSKISLQQKESDITTLTATIKYPSGKEEPCRLTKKEDTNQLGFVFSPKEKGDHLLTVKRDGKLITGSPFKVSFKDDEVGNAKAVQASGKALTNGICRTANEIDIVAKGAGYGVLFCSVEGRNRAEINCVDKGDGHYQAVYKPSEPGQYLLTIKYADAHISGSPFTVKVEGDPSGKVVEKITSRRHVLPEAGPGRMSELCLKLEGTDPFDMEALMAAPDGYSECCEIMDMDDYHYGIRFTPKIGGVHIIGIKHKGLHILGSPFQYTVGKLTDTGAHKVRAFGTGLVKGEIDRPCLFNIYTHEAGAGSLSIAVEGASKATIDFEERSIPGSVGCSFKVSDPGDYMVAVKWDDQHIPDSPFLVHVTPDMGDARKVTVAALRQQGLEIGKAMTFKVMTHGAPGELTGYVMVPTGEEKDIFLQEMDKGEYAVRLVPEENGPHYIHVHFNGHDIPGSPFYCGVGKSETDPGMVSATGDGLSKATTGNKNKFFVNTCNAGAAFMDVIIEGPSKAQIHSTEKEEGYEFSYIPTAPGDYYVTIKYAGSFHVAGSPFKVTCTGTGRPTGCKEKARCLIETVAKSPSKQKGAKFINLGDMKSDAAKVVCKGNGVKKAFVNKKSMFTIETRGAGENCLFLGILGAEGPANVDEVIFKKSSRTTYNVSYVIKQKGQFHLMIKYGEDQVNGSPFPIDAV